MIRCSSLIAVTVLTTLPACFEHSPKKQVARIVKGELQYTRYVSEHAYEAYINSELALNRGQNEVALKWLKRALSEDSRSPFIHSQLAALYWQLKQKKDAIRHLQAALQLNPRFDIAINLQKKLSSKVQNVQPDEKPILSNEH